MRSTHNLLKTLYDELKESFAAESCPIVDWACARIYDEIGDDLDASRARPCDVAAYDEFPLDCARDADKPAVLAANARREVAERSERERRALDRARADAAREFLQDRTPATAQAYLEHLAPSPIFGGAQC